MSRKARIATTLAVTAAAVASQAAPASAATVTITGDAGAPVTLAPNAPTTLRQMKPDIGVALAASERAFSISVAGPVAPAATPRRCGTSNIPWRMDYQGNGTYTITVTTYTNTGCTTGAKAATYVVNLAPSVAITPPGGKLLTRRPNDFATITYQVPVTVNPGALSTNLYYALGGVAAPDGSISGAAKEAWVDTTTGTAGVRFDQPGSYLMTARGTGYTGAAGQFFTPWAAPVGVRAYAPFDFQGTPTFPDARGPRYKIRAQLRERSARGKVRILMARGKGKFRSIGKARINKRGVLKKKFTQHRTGRYRVRFVYKGGATVAPGKVTYKIRIKRRLFF